MKISAFVISVALAGLVAGCFGRPTVQATYVPFEKFEGLTCPQLDLALDRAYGRLSEASREPTADEQSNPLDSLTAGISKLRGEPAAKASAAQADINAISVAQIRMRCKSF